MTDLYAYDQIMRCLRSLNRKMERIMLQLETLTAEVTRTKEVAMSAVTLIQGLATKIEELKADPVALQALADELRTSSDALGAAVAANTTPE
jgi:prefoldin subunit 5